MAEKKPSTEVIRSLSMKRMGKFAVPAMSHSVIEVPQGSASKMTSTPAIPTGYFPSFDASAIAADASYVPATIKEPVIAGARKKLPLRAVNRVKVHNTSAMPRIAMSSKPKAKQDPDQFTEEELDVLYSQYIQAVYLESKEKKSLDLRTKDAMEKLRNLWAVNQLLMEEGKNWSRQLDGAMYVRQLIDCCEYQNKMIQCVNDVIPKAISALEDIAKAVETIRHKLPAPMVSVPSDPKDEDAVCELAKQCESLMHEFHDVVQGKHGLGETKEFLNSMVQLMENVEEEIKRCANLLSSADRQAIEETSLRIGQLM